MLKTKIASIVRRLSLPSKTKKQRMIIYSCTLLLLVFGYFGYYHIRTNSSAQQKLKLRTQAGNLIANDDYDHAAKKFEQAYNKDKDDESKASDAFNTGQAYQSEQNYDLAIEWYNKALVSYRASGDKDGQDESKQAISMAQKFKQTQGKTPVASPVDKSR